MDVEDASSDADSDIDDNSSVISDSIHDNWEEGVAENMSFISCDEQYTVNLT